MRIILLFISLLALLPLYGAAATVQDDHREQAPFEAVRWTSGTTECLVDGNWYQLLSIDEIASDVILGFCERTWPGKAHKRFGEDLVEAMTLMGSAPANTVTLEIRSVGGEVTVLHGVAMTNDKRQKVWRYNNDNEHVSVLEQIPILSRLFGKPEPAYADLSVFVEGDSASETLSVDKAIQDLIWLESRLREQFSYLERTGIDLVMAGDAVVAGIGKADKGLTKATFGLALKKYLAKFGDGHTRIGSLGSFAKRGYAPYLLADTDKGVVAFHEDRSSFLDPEFPFVVAIGGMGIDDWVEAAKPFEALGSSQFQRVQGLRNLRYITHMRVAIGGNEDTEIRLTLASETGETKLHIVEASLSRRGIYGTWPRTDLAKIDNNIGYLRIESMASEASFTSSLMDAMDRFRDTDGLVIDVRGNGGGSRDALKTLLPYFISKQEGPVVTNVGAYRLGKGQDPHLRDGYLDNRSLYPAAWTGWTKEQKAAIEGVRKTFQPSWELPKDQFSDWHYMLLDGKSHDRAYAYKKPVVVLVDSFCFSATDIFAGAFADRPTVMLIGEATGGGSGRSRSVTLPNTGFRIRMSSMASFRPNGDIYEGRGIAPDIQVKTTPGYWIGTEDPQLKAAMDLLGNK